MTDDHHISDSEEISSLYPSIGREQPSARADELILTMARKAAAQRQASRGHWVKRWSTPISIAAVLVLSVSIVSVIKQEALRTPDVSALDTADLNEKRVEIRQQRNGGNSPALQRSLSNSRSSVDVPFEEPSSATSPDLKEKMQAELAPPQEMLARKRTPKNDERRPTTPLSEAKSAVDTISKNESEQTSATAAIAEMESASAASSTRQEKKSRAMSEKPTSAAISDSSPPQHIANTSDRPTAKTRVNKSVGITNDDLVKNLSKPIPAQEHDAAGAAILHNRNSAASISPALKLNSTTTMALCADTSEAKCLNSTRCMLVISGSGFQCRAAINHCETNFSQQKYSAELCQQRAGCDYRPGKCRCDDAEKCHCDKTGPPLCEPLR